MKRRGKELKKRRGFYIEKGGSQNGHRKDHHHQEIITTLHTHTRAYTQYYHRHSGITFTTNNDPRSSIQKSAKCRTTM